MADQNAPAAPQNPSQTTGWFNDAPGGDIDLDKLFPNPELALQAPSQPPAAEPAAPQAPAAEQYFLKTATGTVYKSAEDAIRGTEEKDRVIQQLREKIAQSEGQDPLKKSQQAAQPPVEADYRQSP